MDAFETQGYNPAMRRKSLSAILVVAILICPAFCETSEAKPACLRTDALPGEHHHAADCSDHACFCTSNALTAPSEIASIDINYSHVEISTPDFIDIENPQRFALWRPQDLIPLAWDYVAQPLPLLI